MKETIKSVLNAFATILIILILFIGVVQTIFLIVGPDYKKGEYTMVYKVHYPYGVKTYAIKNDYPIDLCSDRGTNYIEKTIKIPIFKNMFSGTPVFKTSAPIEVVNYTFNKHTEGKKK